MNDLLHECSEECRPSRLPQMFEMSRDIRTPLHFILGLVEIAKNNYSDPEMLQKYLEGIRVSGEYLMTLLDSIMQTSCSRSCPEITGKHETALNYAAAVRETYSINIKVVLRKELMILMTAE